MSKLEDRVKQQLCTNFRDGEVAAKPHHTEKYKENYLADYNMNLYSKLSGKALENFTKGSGNELLDQPAKMKAKYSSSAFGVNLFGYDKIKIISNNNDNNNVPIPIGEYNIEYEKQLSTIIGSNAPANIDVYLSNKDCAVFIEVKLTEPILEKKKQEISNSYLNSNNYYIDDDVMKETFINAFKQLSDNKTHQYDAMQMLKHLLGICNTIEAKNSKLKGKQVFLINCHCWNPLIDKDGNEKSDFKVFGNEFINSVKKITDEYKIKVLNITHKQMMEIMEMDEGRREYVEQRYNLESLK